ncbi:hypothetical protein SBV1_70024 [Verrucomicrobia bacterium]|nr:hypothetical protein SBV1_70024 [Verrucomicrobiota bacterium]
MTATLFIYDPHPHSLLDQPKVTGASRLGTVCLIARNRTCCQTVVRRLSVLACGG